MDRLEQIWELVTAPSLALQETDERRQARLLAGLLFCLIVLAVAGEVATQLLSSAPESTESVAIWSGITILCVAYILSRSRHYRAAAGLTIGATIVTVTVGAATPNQGPAQPAFLTYLLPSILLSSIFFSLRATILVGLIDVAAMLIVPFLNPQISLADVVAGPLSYVIILAALFLLANHHRNLLEHDRQASLAQANERLRQQQALAETLIQVAEVLNTNLEAEHLLDLILEQLARVVEYDSASVMLIQDDVLEIVAQRGLRSKGQFFTPAPVAGLPLTREILDNPRSYIVPDTHAEPRWVRQPGGEYIRCWLGIPLFGQEGPIGIINIDKEQAGFYEEHHARIAQAFANQAATAIENARLFQAEQQRRHEAEKLLEQLQETQAQLIQSAKMAAVGALAAGVTHEINNPLTSVMAFAELVLLATDPEDPRHEDMEVVVQEAQRAQEISRNLLSFARQSSRKRQAADVNQIVRDTLALVRRQMEKEDIDIEEVYAPDLPLLDLDVNGMKQVFLNLINNAHHAMSRGDRLTIRSECLEDTVVVRVQDTGRGIPAQDLASIFKPFFTTKPADQGTGLGLSISRGIVQEHGGRIEVESQVGQGSTFRVRLPLDEAS
ncbi:MAG: ATP-binding protein [Anaerolineae bacterium]|jgi:signal transduction histidine kinase